MSPWEDPFPFRSVGSLDKLIQTFEAAALDEASPLRVLARDVVADLERVPELRGSLSDPELLNREQDLIARMMTAVFPAAGSSPALGAAVVPFMLAPFYQTPAAKDLGVFDADHLLGCSNVTPEQLAVGKKLSAYQLILERFYDVACEFTLPLVVSLSDRAGLQTHLQFLWSPEFLSVEAKGPIPELSPRDLTRILENPSDEALMEELLPASLFEFRGFTVVNATDVTPREVVSRLKDDLIGRHAMATPERIDLLQTRIRNLVRSPDAVLGFLALDRSECPGVIDRARPLGRSLLDGEGGIPCCPKKEDSLYASASRDGHSLVVNDLSGTEVRSGLEHRLSEQGFRSVILVPLRFDDKLVGLMELASPRPGAFSAFTALLLEDVAPLFATAVRRALEERADRIEAAIKKNYTAIHPAVEWKFREAADEILSEEGAGEIPDVVFENVYPLYGLADIRGSSDRRNVVIQEDLTHQLELALAAVRAGAVARPMTVLDELAFRTRQHLQAMGAGLRSEDERTAIDFLAHDVEPLLDRIAGFSEGARSRVAAYRDSIDPRFGVVYSRRNDFEQSVASINSLVARVIRRQEALAQETVPHLFESFKTDGVDYNVYAGASILANGDFDPLFLRDLRLWQLKMHSEIEWEAARCLPSVEESMELTHLVLVQDHPLSIRFRVDEKRFDVDGAYNIRYEIIKKRIDKATIRGSGERLTQPGSLAVVYSQLQEAQEYRRYLDFLIADGYFVGPVEEVELDDMQGVFGLRAFRVSFAPYPPNQDHDDASLPMALESRMGGSSPQRKVQAETKS